MFFCFSSFLFISSYTNCPCRTISFVFFFQVFHVAAVLVMPETVPHFFPLRARTSSRGTCFRSTAHRTRYVFNLLASMQESQFFTGLPGPIQSPGRDRSPSHLQEFQTLRNSPDAEPATPKRLRRLSLPPTRCRAQFYTVPGVRVRV